MIYAVEDSVLAQEILKLALQENNFTYRFFESADALFAALKKPPLPELILLDLILPDRDGMEVLKCLKATHATRNVPVMIMTAENAEFQKVEALESGAEDYIVKPFSLRELGARIRVVLRRFQQSMPMDLECGVIHLSLVKRQVSIEGRPVSLTMKEFDLLKLLMENADLPVARKTLLESIWGCDKNKTRTLDVHIRMLRNKLGEAGNCIQTVRGVGYQLASRA